MQQGDVGAPVSFALTLPDGPYPIPDGATVQLWIRQPSGRLVQRVFQVVDAPNGQVYYETVPGDLAEWGAYRFQARVLLENGSSVAFSPVDDAVGRNVFPATVYVLPGPAILRLGLPEVGIS